VGVARSSTKGELMKSTLIFLMLVLMRAMLGAGSGQLHAQSAEYSRGEVPLHFSR
jgi:hypothetical protein